MQLPIGNCLPNGTFMLPLVILQGVGSGFVWDEEGHVVTNYHVINDSANVKVCTQRCHGLNER